MKVPMFYGPFAESNQIVACRVAARELVIDFADGRSEAAPDDVIPEILQVFGVTDVSELRDVPVEVRSEPRSGYAKLDDGVYVAPLSEKAGS